MMVSTSVLETVPSFALIVDVVEAETPSVLTAKVAEVAPAGITTLVGTVAVDLLDVRLTVAPPVGAATVRETVPVDDAPPIKDVGESARDASLGTDTDMS